MMAAVSLPPTLVTCAVDIYFLRSAAALPFFPFRPQLRPFFPAAISFSAFSISSLSDISTTLLLSEFKYRIKLMAVLTMYFDNSSTRWTELTDRTYSPRLAASVAPSPANPRGVSSPYLRSG